MASFIPHLGVGSTIASIGTQIINDLVANGMVLKYVNLGSTSDTPPNITATKATLESGNGMDSLYATQPWRMQLDYSGSTVLIYLGTSVQLPDAGTTTGSVSISGMGSASYALPWNYYTIISDHGMAIYMYKPSMAYGEMQALVVQRPVSISNGTVLTTQHAPVIAWSHRQGGTAPDCSIIREDDYTIPTAWVSVGASVNARTLFCIGSSTQPAVLPDYNFNYPIQGLNGFVGSRFTYPEELDMVYYMPASVSVSHVDMSISCYGSTRTYFSTMPWYGGYGRLILLKQGGGIA